jgi:hypothetical protein
MDFKSFIEKELFVEFAQKAFDAPHEHKRKSATKQQIVDIWSKIQPDLPIYITPMDDTYNAPGTHSTYGEDGVRITGSWPFIASILGRLKDMLTLDNPSTKLKLVFRGIKPTSGVSTSRQVYAFYINLERSKPEISKVDTGI